MNARTGAVAHPVRTVWLCMGLAAVYGLVAKLSLSLASVHPSATAVWPPTGIALAASLVWGYRVWPGIFAGAFLADVTTAGSAWTSMGIAAGNTLEAMLGLYLVTRFARGPAAFERPADTLKFAGLAGVLCPVVSATCGVTNLVLGGFAERARYGDIWLTWWLGDVGGALLVTPLLLLWTARPRLTWAWTVTREMLLAQALVVFVAVVVFGGGLLPIVRGEVPEYLAIPPLVWVAFRLGRRATALAVTLLSTVALWGTLRGAGPFAVGTTNESLLLVVGFTSVVAVTALTLAAAVSDRARVESVLHEKVNERERAYEALRAESRFRELLESAPDAMVIADRRGEMVLVNTQTEKMFGYPREELIGHRVEILLPKGTRARHEILRDQYVADAQIRNLGPGLDLRGRRRDGAEFPVEISLSPIQTDDGLLVVSAIRDVSERKRTEEKVAHLAALVENARDAVYSKRLDGTIVSWNPGAEQMYGYSAEEIEGKSVALLAPPDQENELPELLGRLRRGWTIEGHETMRRRKDGQLIHVSLTMCPIRDADGRVTAASVIARDITEGKRAQAALGEINRELEAFASTVSHDLRAPLRQLASLADALVEDYGDALDETGRTYARRLSSVALRMDGLTRGLLEYSRVSQGYLPLGSVALDDALVEACANLEAEIKSRGASVVVQKGLPRVRAHEATLTRIVGNLLSNAVKFVARDVKPEVHVWAEDRGRWQRLWVKDNGIGIEARFHDRIFRAFERLHGNDVYPGTGLGLATVHKAVERMGGRVGLESDGQQGSRFWVEFRKERE